MFIFLNFIHVLDRQGKGNQKSKENYEGWMNRNCIFD